MITYLTGRDVEMCADTVSYIHMQVRNFHVICECSEFQPEQMPVYTYLTGRDVEMCADTVSNVHMQVRNFHVICECSEFQPEQMPVYTLTFYSL